MPVVSLDDLLGGRSGRKIGTPELKLSDSVVTHDSIDKMEFANFADDSPRFRRICVEEAPVVEPDVQDPDPIDFTTATSDDIREWQEKARAAREAREAAEPYMNWDKLTRDTFYSYHTHDQPQIVEPVDPSVELHKRIMPKLITTDDHAEARNMTRDEPTAAAIASMAAVKVLRDLLGDQLSEQAKEAQEYAEHEQRAREAVEELEDLRGEARDHHEQGQPVPDWLRDQIKQLVQDKRAAQAAAAEAAQQQTPMNAEAMQVIEQAAAAGAQAAEDAGCMPSFGSGLGQGEPIYESPEQALSIAEMWANNPKLRQMAALFGKLDKDIRLLRSKRIVGGNDEIVDVKFGDDLSRVLPSELALLSDEDTELDFLARFASSELLVWSTVGEENAGRGPIVVVLDGSYSMNGPRNIWARAICMCLLHIARLEKRDFACVEFAGGTETEQWVFPARQRLDPELIVTMASHFFGGGTTPIIGVAAGAKLMDNATEFRKADLVMVGDGDASFGPEDKRLRDHLIEKGVRLFGIAIGDEDPRYLRDYCEHVVHVADFELDDPSQATAELATHIT